MSKRKAQGDADMLDEYDFSGGVRGKYAGRYRAGRNIVLLEPDIAALFPDSGSVNRALRALAEVALRQAKPPRKRTRK